MKKTLVLGASPNSERYSFVAANRLAAAGHEIVLVGQKAGKVAGHEILQGKPDVAGLDTVTMYMGEERQREFEDYVLGLKPARIIFNPGAENPQLERRAKAKGIEVVEGCTLVMLSVGTF